MRFFSIRAQLHYFIFDKGEGVKKFFKTSNIASTTCQPSVGPKTSVSQSKRIHRFGSEQGLL